MFEKGDIVECIESDSGNEACPAIIKGHHYIINEVRICKGCKGTFFDIGFTPLTPLFDNKCECGAATPISKAPFYESTFFRKIEPLYRAVEVSEQVMKELKLITEERIEQTERIDK